MIESPAPRFGAVTRDGEEVVLGVALSHIGENAKNVVEAVKAKLAAVSSALPDGMVVKPIYERTDLVNKAVGTATSALLEGSILVAVILFLVHALFKGVSREDSSIPVLVISIGLSFWVQYARTIRGSTLVEKNKDYVHAARLVGLPAPVIMLRHVLPNVIGPVMIYATLTIPQMILFESFLSYLGLGVQEPMTSWGALLEQGAKSIEVAVWELLFPAGFLVTTLFCFNYVGDGLRDALDPAER